MYDSLHELLRTAFAAGATDVFLTEEQTPRVRADGEVIIAHGPAITREFEADREVWVHFFARLPEDD